jgi:transposase-like protein
MRGEILGLERRRLWRDEDKVEIVMSVGIGGATVTQVAQRHEVTRQQIYAWRPARKRRRSPGSLAACQITSATTSGADGLAANRQRSTQIGELLQIGNCGDQPLLRKDRQIFVNTLGRVLEARAHFAQC